MRFNFFYALRKCKMMAIGGKGYKNWYSNLLFMPAHETMWPSHGMLKLNVIQ